MQQPIKVILYIMLGLILLAIASVIINEGSIIVASVFEFIMQLFENAELDPASHGFGPAIQLIAIAWFVGWTIHRFKSRK